MNYLRVQTGKLNDESPVIHLTGRFSMEDATELGNLLEEYHKTRPQRIIIDCQQLEQLSSAAIGVLVGNRQVAQKYGGQVLLVAPNRTIRQVLSMTGVDTILKICETMDEALGIGGESKENPSTES